MKTERNRVIVVQVDRCLGCRSCEIACAVAHSESKDLKTAAQSGERPGYRVNVEAVGPRAVPVHCNHCEDAPCVAACPTGAVHRESEDGPVLIEAELCIGCKMCVQACPFGVITLAPDGKGILKCDQCVERLARGEEPACVAACPTKALVSADEGVASKEKRRKAAGQMVSAAQEGQTSGLVTMPLPARCK